MTELEIQAKYITLLKYEVYDMMKVYSWNMTNFAVYC